MPKASEVAAELRKFADSLDTNPDAEVLAASIYFYHWNKKNKERFMALAKLLPRPLKKALKGEAGSRDLVLTYESDALHVHSEIPQAATCTLVEPAKPAVYRCDPILSDEENEALEVA